MRYRVCSANGCPKIIEGQSKCNECRREVDRVRGTSKERGYSFSHVRARAEVKPAVEAGGVICWRCGQQIEPSEPWDYGHDDDDRSAYRGPEHRACNRATKTHAYQRKQVE